MMRIDLFCNKESYFRIRIRLFFNKKELLQVKDIFILY
jgi:hypothetical protein